MAGRVTDDARRINEAATWEEMAKSLEQQGDWHYRLAGFCRRVAESKKHGKSAAA